MFLILILQIFFEKEYIAAYVEVWLSCIGIYSVVFMPFAIFYIYKMIYLLKHYQQFKLYEVVLDNVSTSYVYKGAVYYTVSICDGDTTKRVCTNPYFSSNIFSTFTLDEYNNKKVIGLYDDILDKFYIIKLH